MAGEIRTPSVKTRVAFLEAVVCGRPTVNQRFKDWFPNLSGKNLEELPRYARWRMETTVWRNPNLRPSAQPTNDKGIYEEMLRHQLRVIWHRAVAGTNPKAPVTRLRAEVREFQHLIRRKKGGNEPGPDVAVWCQKTESALAWLERNTHKLRLCKLTDCKRSRYFIVSPKRKKFCCDECSELVEVERSIARVKEIAEAKRAAAEKGQGTQKNRLTPEGRIRIVKAVKARWKRYRGI